MKISIWSIHLPSSRESMECGTFISWRSFACILLPTSAGLAKMVCPVFLKLKHFNELALFLSLAGQDETNEEIEFTPLPTEPSELSSLTAMIKKTATD